MIWKKSAGNWNSMMAFCYTSKIGQPFSQKTLLDFNFFSTFEYHESCCRLLKIIFGVFLGMVHERPVSAETIHGNMVDCF